MTKGVTAVQHKSQPCALLRKMFTSCSSPRSYAKPMTMLVSLLIGLAVPAPSPPTDGAWAQRSDQRDAFRARQLGRILPLREIEGRVLPTMRGSQYLGFDYDTDRGIYTLKFLRDGTVIWVEVDGRSGQIIGRTGN